MNKILVIEDKAKTRSIFQKGMEAEGFFTINAENGQIGVERSQQDVPDLIVCDVMMPKLDGYHTLATLKQNPITKIIPFIFVTAKATGTDIRRGMELGADDYLAKSCTMEELLTAIKVCLYKRASLKQWYGEHLAEVVKSDVTTTKEQTNSQSIFPSSPKLKEVFRFIEANYHQAITLNDVASVVGYSPSYLTNLVRRETGKTVQNWIIERRMAQVRLLLLSTPETVEMIAFRVGYQNMVHFFRQFRQKHGTTPQLWRKSQLALTISCPSDKIVSAINK